MRDEIDFDKLDENTDKFEHTMEFPIEEDMVNLGAWVQLHHPNFFDGSSRGHMRYIYWLINTLLISSL